MHAGPEPTTIEATRTLDATTPSPPAPSTLTARVGALLPTADLFLERAEGGGIVDGVAGQGFDLVLLGADSFDAADKSLTLLAELATAPPVIVLLPTDDVEQQAALLANGAYAVLSAELPDDELTAALTALLDRRREEQLVVLEAEQAQDDLGADTFVSKSPAMQRLLEMVDRVANASSPVLILGETGVGKERIANLVHSKSPRESGPFIALNCAAIPSELVESELFGHEKGAFTGATKTRRGYFRAGPPGHAVSR